MIEEKMEELANEMKAALKAARKIPQDILHHSEEMQLTRDDYKTIATSLFIEYNKQRYREEKKDGKYEGPSSEKQQNFLGILATEKDGATEIISAYLDANGKKSMEELTATEATSLITQLKELPKKERRPNRAPR
jgi:hypothetical protein